MEIRKVAAISHSFADPTPYVAAARAAGVKVLNQVQTVAQAQRAARAGVDFEHLEDSIDDYLGIVLAILLDQLQDALLAESFVSQVARVAERLCGDSNVRKEEDADASTALQRGGTRACR